MARTVLSSSSEVFHHWAHQVSDSQRCGNVSYEGPALYSYAAVIALHVDLPKGRGKITLITGDRYSVTTSGHISGARSAVSHLDTFQLPSGMRIDSYWQRLKPVEMRRAIRDKLKQHAASAFDDHERLAKRGEFRSKVMRAKSWEVYLNAARKANEFCSLMGLPPIKVAESDGLTDDAIKAYREQRASREAAERQREEDYRRQRIEQAMESLTAWLDGAPGFNLSDLPTASLRISPSNPEVVETTMGASVPIEHVRRAAPIILRLLARGEAWQTNGKTIHLGHYKIDRVEEDGTVVAGCHRFERAEIERFAQVIGVEA